MKPSKKKPGKKSSKGKPLRGATVTRKTTTKKTVRAVGKNKTRARVKSSESVQAEIRRLSGQLKQKERELEIEAALERVRSSAMAMHNSNDIPATTTIVFTELQKLGTQSIRCGVGLLSKDSHMAQVYAAATSDGEFHTLMRTISMTEHSTLAQQYETWLKQENYQTVLKGEDLKSYYNLPFFHSSASYAPPEHFDQKEYGYYFPFPEGLFYAWAETSYSESELNILNRFKTIIALTFRRYLDLKKAEAQAREAQIEAALERVRSRSMGMQKSEELKEVIQVVYEQFVHLNIHIEHTGFIMDYKTRDDMQIWLADRHEVPSQVTIPYFDSPHWNSFNEAKVKGQGFFANKLNFEEKNRFYQKLFEFVPGLPEESKEYYISCPGLAISTVLLENIGLYIENFSGVPYSDEENATLMRFGKVFQQTYTRFLDLEKAEEQTRLAQIEASLERVRARAMGMHHSDELSEVLSVLFDQFDVLGIRPVYTFLSLVDLDKNKFTYRQTGKGGQRVVAQQVIDLDRMEEWKDLVESMRAGKVDPINCFHFPKESLEKVWEVFDEIYSALPEGSKVYPEDFPDGVYATQAYCKFGYLGFDHTRAASEEDKDILQRFAKEFTRLYQRFLDLQRAEAQAREAQIQLALERVRARTMAMQHSNELPDAANLLFQQVQSLGMPAWSAGYCIWDENKETITFWMCSEGVVQPPIVAPVNVDPSFNRFYQACKRGENFYVEEIGGEALASHYQYVRTLQKGGETIDTIIEAGFQLPTFQIFHLAYFAQGFLTFITFEQVPDAWDIFKRFAKVFEQTYTRFLDLQKAEAQAREAQIEAALERVRSRTMAMQHSDELLDVASILFQQVKALGVPQWNCGFNIWDIGDKEFTYYPGSPDGIILPSPCKIPLTEHPVFISFDESRKRGEELFVYEKEGEYQAGHYRYMLSLPGVGDLLQSMLDAGFQLPTFQIDHIVNFSRGNLIFITYEHFPEMHDIFKRFGKVFEQTYTRFLDLQKAEAQAKEAQIEAALEKVRSRSLAMHKSDEVGLVVDELFLRMKDLEIGFDSVNILEFTDDAFQVWAAYKPGKFTVTKIPFSKSDIPYVRSAVEAKSKGLKLFTHQYLFEEKNQFLKYLFEETHFKNLPDERKQFLLQCPCYTVSIGFAKNTAIQLQSYSRAAFSESENNILKRFVNVFEQAYTRFLDLQQAEGQAREAQIQLALERVRARTMAMQNSNELRDAASLLFQQVKELGIDAWTCGFSIWDEDRKAPTAWLSRGVMQPPFKTPLTENQTLMHFYEAAQRGESLFVEEVSGETLTELYRYLGTLLVAEGISGEIRKPGYAPPTFQVNHVAYFSYGYLLFITYKPYPEAHDIFKRFAKVFEQTYTRFLDLQRAEAQARESQIEASLERVRSKTMAMHNSQDVGDTVATVFNELLKLNIKTNRCGILIFSNFTDAEVWTAKSTTSGKANLIIGHLDVTRHPMLTNARNSWKNKAASFSYELIGDDLINYYRMINNQPDYPISINMESLPSKEIHTEFYFPDGAVFAFTPEPIAADDTQIFKRLASVFGQTYRRYLDLQKAEAQAREAQIEAALERVRSRTMAMHRSEEIADIVGKILKELTLLDVALNRVLIWIFNHDEKYITWWSANPEAERNAESYRVDYVDHPVFSTYFFAWQKKLPLLLYTLGDDLKVSWDDHLFKNTELSRLPKAVQDGMRSEKKIFTTSAIGEYGLLMAGCFEPFSDEVNDIIQRFGRVFQQSYTRYVDVQKAEAQAREAQIEAALERTRTQSMLMQHSVQLDDTLRVFHEQVLLLGIKSAFSFLWLPDEKNDRHIFWAVWAENSSSEQVKKDTTVFNSKAINYPLDRNEPATAQCLVDWKSDQPVHSYHVRPADVENYFAVWKELLDGVEKLKAEYFQGGLYYVEAFMKYGCFGVMIESEMPEDEKKILGRLAIEFERAYTRFLDLQKAEAQAREAQIETALEKVRSRSLIMRESTEIKEVITVVLEKIHQLGIAIENRSAIILEFQPGYRVVTQWVASPLHPQAIGFLTPYFDNPILADLWDAKEKGIEFYENPYAKDDKDSLFSYFFDKLGMKTAEESLKYIFASTSYSLAVAFEQNSAIAIATHTGKLLVQEEIELLRRFARVFEQSYTRFLDLKKVEEQAREATIEASLEKVRGKAMAMHNSNDLTSTASLVFTELRKLGIDSFRSGVGLLSKENRKVKLFSATSSEEGGSLSLVGWAVLDHHPVLSKTYDSWINNEDYFPVLKGESLRTYYEQVVSTFTVPAEHSEGYEQYGYFLPFSEGLFYGWSEKPYTDADIKILNRFRAIVDLTFRRYMELQKSEENAMEAIRQASLDRVRAEIASMRTTADLDRITPLIWKELNILNIPFVRCGVFIMDKPQHKIHTFLSTPEGKAIAAFNLPYETSGNVGEILTHWLDKQTYISHWDESAFSELGEQLVQQGAIPSKEVYMSTVPSGGIHLHCLPFLQGMLYVGNTTQLQESDIHLIQSVADAFSTAYARYEDFNKLESAKAQIEKTLADLKQTQNLLLQSEKMASLGELTAGIAHEIQNPLNFVNNFSEVSNELLDEMKEEIQKGNYDEVQSITNNIKQNLEKILHHGQRADGIVKGMLQHSRSSSGVKEPTDINALADEYLRLAYHGFRAKDKSFNASTNTDLDKSIGKINVVPQDIGRVVLNLITNAFYAVTEKQKQTAAGYQPTVSVSTKRHDDCVLISVKDNGNGIPEQIREKIFQPFFTTKPTGQGTGLGLSLSYDIVKAHGGELQVKTNEGEGSEFVVSLPV